jgi:hypothetical protein
MDELVGHLVADEGIDRNAAEGAGLSMGQVQGATRQFIAYARGKVGEDVLGEIVGAIPGLAQFV